LEQVVRFLFKYSAALFAKSQFGFAARPSLFVIAALAVSLAFLVYFLYVTPSVRLAGGWRAALILVRCLLVVVIVVCIMRPVIVVPSVLPQSSYVAVLMDDSASMKLPGEGGGSRLDQLKELMSPGSRFLSALSDKFKVRAYRFSSKAERVQDASEVSGGGEQTDLPSALRQASREAAGLPLAGIIVISDGASNVTGRGDASDDMTAALSDLRGRGTPVFAVGLGPSIIEDDVEIARANAPRRSLAGSPVTTELLINSGGAAKTIKVDISEDNHLLRSQDVPVQRDSSTVARLTFTPSSPGLHHYTFTALPVTGEPIPDNNSQELLIDVQDTKPRVLYIEGEPRWEYPKLREAVAEEKNIVLVSVLRSADGKFYRQGIENADELAGGFPRSEEDLFKYESVMIGSCEATFFTFDQLKAMEQFVSRRGGSLIALGGPKSFNAGGYATTPLADLLPVYLSGTAVPTSESQTFKAAPSDRGREHPAARLAEDPDANAKAWDQMPAITLPEIITETKPGATVILDAVSTRDKRAYPLLVEERYGRGRSLALLASDTWRWRMMLESKNTSFETFWRNLLRHLVDSVRRPVEANTDRSFYPTGEPVRIRADVADEKFLDISGATVTAKVSSPSGKVFDVALKQTNEGGADIYAASFLPDEEGQYRIEVAALKGSGGKQTSIGSSQTSFLVGAVNREARNAAQNRELLKRVASDTGGNYYPNEQVSRLIDDITHTEGAGSIKVTYDLWDMPINFLLVVALASAEWFIRKRKGLA
jgi:uncharacterized membrane protein